MTVRSKAQCAVAGAAALALLALAPASWAETHGPITVSSGQVRASLKGSPNSAAYMVIANASDRPDALLAARCACAQSIDIHKTEETGGMSMMASAAPVAIPAHGQLAFRPGGYHLMLMGLKGPLRDGGQQDITLVFQHAGAVRTGFAIRATIR